MERRQLANTDLMVSPLGLGTVKLGRDQGVKYPESFQIPDDKAANALLKQAKQAGINLLDTAPAYGRSEERLGLLLQGQRKDWVICTKTGEEFEGGQSSYHFDEQHTRFSIERSLRRLHTDYLDIVLVHSSGDDINIIEQYGILEQLAMLKQQGLIRAFGMSTKTTEGGLLAAQQADIVMVTYNPACSQDKAALDYCQDHNKASFIKKAFASGHLCQTHTNPVQANLDFVFAHQGVTSVIIGTINPAHMSSNIAAAEAVLKAD